MLAFLREREPLDAREIAPLVISYRPGRQPGAPATIVKLLETDPEPTLQREVEGSIVPAAAGLSPQGMGFAEAFAVHREVAATHGLGTWRDLLRLNVRHVSEAVHHVTNGQATVTIIELAKDRCSVALHPRGFLGDYSAKPSFSPDHTSTCSSVAEGEQLALSWLLEPSRLAIRVRVHGDVATLSWRTWGALRDVSGYERRGLVLQLGTDEAWTELTEWWGGGAEPHEILKRAGDHFPGVEAESCATCAHFSFSGMSRDMSGGWAGYCGYPQRLLKAVSEQTGVHEWCDAWQRMTR
jgi:hypothetical protein